MRFIFVVEAETALKAMELLNLNGPEAYLEKENTLGIQSTRRPIDQWPDDDGKLRRRLLLEGIIS